MALEEALQVAPAEVLLGSRAGDWFPLTGGQGEAAEAAYLHRWTNDSENRWMEAADTRREEKQILIDPHP